MRIKSMAKPSMAFAIIAALLLGLLAGPAAADKVKDKDGIANEVKDSGTVTGRADVGKFRTGCANDGTSTVSGPGLGHPLNAPKNAYYRLISEGGVNSLFKDDEMGLEGDLKVCGRLTKMHSAVAGGTGAACGSSKGWDGKGSIVFPSKPTIWLDDLGWKVSVSTFIVTADVVQGNEAYAKDKFADPRNVQDQLVAEIQAQGAGPCATKVDGTGPSDKGGGAIEFDITGSYQILQGQKPDENMTPECKEGLAAGCLNDPKKSGASG